MQIRFQSKKISNLYLNLIFASALSSFITYPLYFLLKAQIAGRKYRKHIKEEWPKEFPDLVVPIANIYVPLSEQIGQEMA